MGSHTLTKGQEDLRIALISAKKQALAAPFSLPFHTAHALTHPHHGRAGPCSASGHAPATRVNGSQRTRPPSQTDGQLDQSQSRMLPGGQSARARGGAPLTSRPLPSSMGPAAAAAGGPGRRSPPVGAVLLLVLAVAAVLVVVLLRRRPRRPRRWPPPCCLTVVRHLETEPRRLPHLPQQSAPRLGGEPRGMTGPVV